jgi:hypothetical protein
MDSTIVHHAAERPPHFAFAVACPYQLPHPPQLPSSRPERWTAPSSITQRRDPRISLLLLLVLLLQLPVLPNLNPPKNSRHLDRSDGQHYRPSRSGETPAFRFCCCLSFTTPTPPQLPSSRPERWTAPSSITQRRDPRISLLLLLVLHNSHTTTTLVISTGAMDSTIVHHAVERPPHFAFAVACPYRRTRAP